MSGDPPHDDPWSDVVSQVSDALSELNLQDGPLRAALLDGLRTALDQAGLSSGDAVPEVTVVEGGRPESEPPTPSQKPELRVADDPTEEELPEVRAHVRVVHMGSEPDGLDEPDWLAAPITHEGRIRVGEPNTQAGWQTVLRASEARAYRVSCERGALEVFLDGEPAEKLATGQTVDVEARLIRVRAAGPEGADGAYARI